MANENFSCFGVVLVNGTNVITPLIPISQKNIPIINLDTGLDPDAVKAAGLKLTSFIGSDNTNAGELAANYMLGLLGDHGDVAILEGVPGEHNGILRESPFRKTTAGKLNIVQTEAADYERDRAMTETEAMLRVHPTLAGIFAANDEMGLGAAQAIANAGKSGQIKVVSIDGVKEALQAVQSGKLSGSVSQCRRPWHRSAKSRRKRASPLIGWARSAVRRFTTRPAPAIASCRPATGGFMRMSSSPRG